MTQGHLHNRPIASYAASGAPMPSYWAQRHRYYFDDNGCYTVTSHALLSSSGSTVVHSLVSRGKLPSTTCTTQALFSPQVNGPSRFRTRRNPAKSGSGFVPAVIKKATPGLRRPHQALHDLLSEHDRVHEDEVHPQPCKRSGEVEKREERRDASRRADWRGPPHGDPGGGTGGQ